MPKLKITWKKSDIGQRKDHGATIKALGLNRLNQTIIQDDSPSIRGMIYKIRHLVEVEENASE
ncbi:MAG: 50S ribosomal protein L30 [Chloroflexi bacterium]|nr:50S ribosomal protein L30 [Chloroflexota bacterium]